jgi:NAD-dependent SIR2 family protein deacetylase
MESNIYNELYCVKCKQKTPTNNLIKLKTKNNKNMVQGKCMKCGTKKCKFVKM